MSERILVKNTSLYSNEVITLFMTLDVLRNQKHMLFILAHDNTGPLQLVVSKSDYLKHDELHHLLPGSTFKVTGKLVASNQSKTQGVELQVHDVEIFSMAEVWPIGEDSHLENRLNFRVVDLKSERSQLMLKLRSTFENACRQFSLAKGMTEIHTPKLMGGASESGSEVFKVKYFETEAFLAQSPQFYKQMGIASGLDGVFEIGPVFRAEQSRSSRHLTEFTGLDVEFAWATSVHDVMNMEADMLDAGFKSLMQYKDEVKRLFAVELFTGGTPTFMTLAEAKVILGLKVPATSDLSDENERQLYEITNSDLIFVYDYPIAKRPFYHKWDNETQTTQSFDLIFKGIEITTGALREHRMDVLSQQAITKNVSLTSIDHYLNNFRYGCPPHGGFGLGIERVIAKLLNYSSVKETAFVARDPERLFP